MIPIYRPYLPKNVLKYAHDAIDSSWISSTGKYIDASTERLKELLGVKHVQLVNNGTSATHLVAKSLVVKNPEIRSVIVPNNVYVAAWNSFLYENIDLLPIDANVETWNIDVDLIPDRIPPQTGLLLVHNVGNILDVPALIEQHGSDIIVEDNCEGFMGRYNNEYSGTQSLASSLSFFGNKTITSGEGGAVVTNDDEIFEFVRMMCGQGQSLERRYVHDILGYNYRMTNIQAAILFGQLDVLSEILEKKQGVFDYYRSRFSKIKGISIQKEDMSSKHSNWMMGIRIHENTNYARIRDFLKVRNIDSRPMFYPMSMHSHLRSYAQEESENVAAKLSRECLILPSFPDLTKDETKHIIDSIEDYVKNEVQK